MLQESTARMTVRSKTFQPYNACPVIGVFFLNITHGHGRGLGMFGMRSASCLDIFLDICHFFERARYRALSLTLEIQEIASIIQGQQNHHYNLLSELFARIKMLFKKRKGKEKRK